MQQQFVRRLYVVLKEMGDQMDKEGAQIHRLQGRRQNSREPNGGKRTRREASPRDSFKGESKCLSGEKQGGDFEVSR